MGKIDDAIKKINDEVQKDPENMYIAAVGEHIIDCIVTKESADAVLAPDKTLSGALEEIRKPMEERARRRHSAAGGKGGRCVEIAVPREEVFKMAREYFGLPEPGTCAAQKGVRLSLEDFL